VIERIVLDAFEDVALLIGGAAALHQLHDDLLWNLLRRLDRVRTRTVARLARQRTAGCAESAAGGPRHTHPAVEEFLLRSRPPGLPVPAGATDPEAALYETNPCER
jgi:hypothetical protein